MTDEAIGVGIAGYGLAGRVFHATLISHTPGLALRGVFSRTGQRRAQARERFPYLTTYETYEALLDDQSIDLVIVATPHDTHEALVVQAAQARKHVVVDKLMCLTVQEGERMIAAARQAQVLFSVFQNRRWDSDYLTVKRVLEQGLVGQPYLIESSVANFGPSSGYRNPTSNLPRGWRTYAQFGGGPFRDWGAHLFDQAVQLCGPAPESVYGDFLYLRDWDVETAGTAYVRYPPVEQHATATVRAEGVRYVIHTGAISAIPPPRWYIRGSEGAYYQTGRDAQEAALNRGEVGPRVMDPEHAPRLVRHENGQLREVLVDQEPGNYLEFYANIAETIRGRASPAVTPESVLDSIRLMLAAARSAQTGEVVHPDRPSA